MYIYIYIYVYINIPIISCQKSIMVIAKMLNFSPFQLLKFIGYYTKLVYNMCII